MPARHAHRRLSRAIAHQLETLEPRRLFAAVAWDGGGDGVDWGDPINWDSDAVPTLADDVTLDVAGSATVVMRGLYTVQSLDNKETLVIRGSGAFGVASLAISATSTNTGTIRLESIDSSYGAYVSGDGTLTNSGTIRAEVGTGGARGLDVNVDNSGSIVCNADVYCAAVAKTFNQQGGSIDTSGGGSFKWVSGTMNLTGGTVGDRVLVSAGTISVGATAPASTVVAEGSTTLINNLSPNVTVWVQGNGTYGGSYLTVNGSVTNAGTILLQSIDSAYVSHILGPGTLTNSGTIRVAAGTGGSRGVDVNLDNSGTIDCDVDLFCSASTKTWNQTGGTVDTSGGGNLKWASGLMNYSGGTLGARVFVSAGTLDVAATAPASTIIAEGPTTLLGNASANTTVWVQGNGYYGNAQLTVNGVVSNAGTILLQSIDSGYGTYVVGLGTLSNSGTLRSEAGTGGPREVDVNLNNSGTITCNTDIFCSASTKTWNQTGGTVDTTGGIFRWYVGLMNYSGGTLGNRVVVTSGTIDIAATAPSYTVIAEGTTTLLANASANTTVWAQGNGYGGTATLNVAGTITNAGTILLQSIDAGYGCYVSGAGILINSGTLRAEAGSGGPRQIDVNLTNSGTVTCNIDIYCSASTKTWNQTGGNVDTSGGTFKWVSGLMNWSGGTLGSRVYILSGTLDVAAGAPASTVILEGSCTLLGILSPNATAWVQGNGYAGGASLTFTGSLTNNGHILLSSVDAGYAEQFTVSGTFTNNGTVTTADGAGGPRYLDFAAVTGTGTIDLSATATLIANSIRQDSLTVAGMATIRNNGGNSGLSIVNALSLPGTGTFDLDNNDLIVNYTSSTTLPAVQAMIVAARNGGNWNMPGLTSTAARNAPNTNLGCIEASDYDIFYSPNELFDGVDPDGSAVLVKYTYNGDANFSGTVNFDDYVRTDIGFNTGRSGWANGDFNYSGSVNFDDYVLIDVAFNTQSGTLGRSQSSRPPRPASISAPVGSRHGGAR